MISTSGSNSGQTSDAYGDSRPRTGKTRTTRPRTGLSTLAGVEAHQVVCSISESRGISPIVGLAFVNLSTWEAILCQICDTQTYVRTVQKLAIRNPSQILVMKSAVDPKSKLVSILEENLDELDCDVKVLDRKYWAEATGIDYIHQLAFTADVEAIKSAIAGSYFAVSCFAAVSYKCQQQSVLINAKHMQAMKYIELELSKSLSWHSLRIKYEPSEGAMMIDLSTIYSLELIQNLQEPKSKDCLFGLLNHTQTPMGSRLLRSNILQPLTDPETITARHDALEELTTREEMFFAVRTGTRHLLFCLCTKADNCLSAFGDFVDADKLLTSIVAIPMNPSLNLTEQNINKVIELRQLISSVRPIHKALTGARSSLLTKIREVSVVHIVCICTSINFC